MRYVLCITYDGTHFSGFQRQGKGERTVQSVLEGAAEKVFGVPTRVVGCGRTDAGVHAREHFVHLDGETSAPAEKLRECFNRILPPDLRVKRSAAAPEGFDVTRASVQKTYCYRAYTAEAELPLLMRYAVRLERMPDLSRMRAAAELLTGRHDFAAFSSTGSSAKTTVRTVSAVTIEEKTEKDHTMYEISVTGEGFLYNMVRIIAGELFAIGLGKDPAFLVRALAGGGRSLLARTMPAAGLTLERVIITPDPFGEEP